MKFLKVKSRLTPSYIISIIGTSFLVCTAHIVHSAHEGRAPEGAYHVDSISWEQIDSPLTLNPNLGNGSRIFPDKLSVLDKVPRNQVRVKVSIGTPVEGVTVYLKSFDVDDPSISWNENIPNPKPKEDTTKNPYLKSSTLDNDTATLIKGGDNRSGSVATITGEVPKEGKFPNSTNISKAVTNAEGIATIVFTVGFQPGDNYRVAATTKEEDLTLINNDNVPADNVAQISGSAPDLTSIRLTPLLTVWRNMHVEFDSMAAPTGNQNKVLGQITGLTHNPDNSYSAILNVNLKTDSQVTNFPTGLSDDSRNLSSPSPNTNKGRFDSGRINIGTGPSSKITSLLDGNGNNYVKTTSGQAFDIPFVLSKPGSEDVTGQILEMSPTGTKYRIKIDATLIPDAYDKVPESISTVNIAGHTFTVFSNTESEIILEQSDVKLDFVLEDDDDSSVLPYIPNTNSFIPKMNEKYAPAYIEIVADGGGNPDNNNIDITFRRNLVSQFTIFGQPRVGQSHATRTSQFWTATIAHVFQGHTHGSISSNGRADGDLEPDMGAEAALNEGFVVYMEEYRERNNLVRNQSNAVVGIVMEGELYAHEIAHLFDCKDWYDNPNSPKCPVEGTCGLMESHYVPDNMFIPHDLNLIRSKRRP